MTLFTWCGLVVPNCLILVNAVLAEVDVLLVLWWVHGNEGVGRNDAVVEQRTTFTLRRRYPDTKTKGFEQQQSYQAQHWTKSQNIIKNRQFGPEKQLLVGDYF